MGIVFPYSLPMENQYEKGPWRQGGIGLTITDRRAAFYILRASIAESTKYKGTVLGTPNREPQEYSRNIIEYKDPGRYIPIIYLLYSWGSRFGVPSRVPLK